jgi:hypothetical protein
LDRQQNLIRAQDRFATLYRLGCRRQDRQNFDFRSLGASSGNRLSNKFIQKGPPDSLAHAACLQRPDRR